MAAKDLTAAEVRKMHIEEKQPIPSGWSWDPNRPEPYMTIADAEKAEKEATQATEVVQPIENKS